MHISHLLATAILCGGIGLFFTGDSTASRGGSAATPAIADGHLVLVVEGDRDQLTITAANHKPEPWAGTPKGLVTNWALSIRDGAGAELQRVPLDLSQFDLQPDRKGGATRVEGCIVRAARVAMLANAPCYAGASAYVFLRGETVVSVVDASAVNQLAGGGR